MMENNLTTRSNSDTPEHPGKFSKAISYSLPIFACGHVLWKIFYPSGDVLCTLAVTEDSINDMDNLVQLLNREQ